MGCSVIIDNRIKRLRLDRKKLQDLATFLEIDEPEKVRGIFLHLTAAGGGGAGATPKSSTARPRRSGSATTSAGRRRK